MAKQMAFYFDASACTSCKACQIACQDKNRLPAYLRWRRVLQYGGGDWYPHPYHNHVMVNTVFSYSISIACMHCEKPLCAEVCPSAAITKRDDGVVIIDTSKCIGCRYCQWACPYGAPQFNEELGVMTKCDFCQDFLAQGQNPACVDACVMRCLHYGDLEELRAEFGEYNAIEPLPAANITMPALVITPHKNAQMSGQGSGKLLNLPEEV
jgi:anaerobic dimethyl sulfoxide reductase subunit B (iron-sulfur subunit)